MVKLEDILKPLSVRHQNALKWFQKHIGTEQPWPKPLSDGTLIASKAKGIYKPSWTKYALSIRQSLGGPYNDQDPVFFKDSTWSYAYYQENIDPEARDSEYTNRGLLECWKDKVPVGVMRQIRAKYDVRYKILGLALVSGWEDGYFYLEGFSEKGISSEIGSGTNIDLMKLAEELVESEAFDPSNLSDGRKRILASIVQRRGQAKFRNELLTLYKGRCAITECEVEETLEAAHISPYMGPDTNHSSNGILLRSDIHVLFDLGLIAIDPESHKVLLSKQLNNTFYSNLEGRTAILPEYEAGRPSSVALEWHRFRTGL